MSRTQRKTAVDQLRTEMARQKTFGTSTIAASRTAIIAAGIVVASLAR